LTLLSSPLPRIDDIYIAVSNAVYDNSALEYYVRKKGAGGIPV
jgi:hypothetical protein